MKFEYHRPMKAIALDPGYSRKTSKRYVAGGLAGQLCFNSKKWLGYRGQVRTSMSIVHLLESLVLVIECCCEFICSILVLHSGEGPIHAVKWRTSLIAWANDAGVKVYDVATDQIINFIERPRGSLHPELLLTHLVWQVS